VWPQAFPHIVLHPAPVCRLQIGGLKGKPPEAGLEVVTDYFPPDMPWLPLREKLRPSADRAEIAPVGYPSQVICAAKGEVPVRVDLHEPCGESPIKVVMEARVCLAGRVLDAGGRAVAGAGVSSGFDSRLPEAVTDKEGRFRLPPLYRDEAPYTLVIRAEGFLPQRTSPLPARNNTSLVITLKRGGELAGRIVDGGDLAPLPEGRVRAQLREGGDPSGNAGWVDSVNQEGEFRFSGLFPGRYDVRAWAPGHAAKSVLATVRSAAPVYLGDIALSAHPEVTGLLVHEDGTPAGEGASVELERTMSASDSLTKVPPRMLKGSVRGDGSFRISGVATGRYRLLASEGALQAVKWPVEVGDDDLDMGAVTLGRAASIDGRLLANVPRDFTGWRVQVTRQIFDQDAPVAECGSDGGFSFTDLAPETCRLRAFEPMHLQPVAMRTVILSPGQAAQVTLPIDGMEVPVFAQVDGLPAAHAWLTFSQPSGSCWDQGLVALESSGGQTIAGIPSPVESAQTDEAGYALLKGVSPGPVQATLSQGGMEYRLPMVLPADVTAPLTVNFGGMVLSG
jgi:hypothetical protein